MQFLVVLVLVAVLLSIGDASELVDSKAEIQKLQQIVDERHEALINVITEHFPDLNKETLHERRLLQLYTKYFGYFQSSTFLKNSQPTCDAGGVPLAAAGVGYGCMPLDVGFGCISGVPCSFALTCSSLAAGIKIGGTLYMGADCDGGVYDGPGAATLAASYEELVPALPHCENGLKYTCAAAGGPPASLYSGYRMTTFWDTTTCMGQPLAYADVYNSPAVTYSCANGQVQKRTSSGSLSNMNKITCNEIVGNSYAYGCVTAMSSLGSRTFISFKMFQSISGVSASTWNGSKKTENVIALTTSLAQVLDVDYDAISNVEITSSSSASSVVTATYTLKIQPGFGNSYTESNVYTALKTKAASSSATSCTGDNCFMTVLKANTEDSSPAVSGGVTGVTYDASATTAPNTITQTPTGIASPSPAPAPTADPEAGVNSAAIVAGIVVVILLIGLYWYTQVYNAKQIAKNAAAQAGLAPAPQVQVQVVRNVAPVYAGAAAPGYRGAPAPVYAKAAAPPPPAYPGAVAPPPPAYPGAAPAYPSQL